MIRKQIPEAVASTSKGVRGRTAREEILDIFPKPCSSITPDSLHNQGHRALFGRRIFARPIIFAEKAEAKKTEGEEEKGVTLETS